ncbi:large ribosomal subunit protein mL39-like [Branchiostoma floridae x Branchiostoma japonicum]
MSRLKSLIVPSVRCIVHRRYCSTERVTNALVTEYRNDIFEEEKRRQQGMVRRLEKIEVVHVGPNDPGTFIMNKNLSTPYHCAMHISETYTKYSVLAMVNGEPWDMWRPLTEDCELSFVRFRDKHPEEANKSYWRSCALILGAVIETAFKDTIYVQLARALELPIIKGMFVYDVDLGLKDWTPAKDNLRSLSLSAITMKSKDLPFERLEVDPSLALRLFQHNQYKQREVEERVQGGKVTLYRMGKFIDIHDGPMMSKSSLVSMFTVAGIHELPGGLCRVQAVSLPHDFYLHSSVWNKLVKRASVPLVGDLSTAGVDESWRETRSSAA